MNLTGQTKVPLTTPLARATRIRNASGTDFLGSIYVFEDDTLSGGVPTTASKVHCIAPAGDNNSRKASTSLSQYDYWIVTNIWADCLKKSASFADVSLQVRENGETFITHDPISCAPGGRGYHYFKPYLVIPANADVRLVASADGASTSVSGGIQGVLAIQSDQANMTIHA